MYTFSVSCSSSDTAAKYDDGYAAAKHDRSQDDQNNCYGCNGFTCRYRTIATLKTLAVITLTFVVIRACYTITAIKYCKRAIWATACAEIVTWKITVISLFRCIFTEVANAVIVPAVWVYSTDSAVATLYLRKNVDCACSLVSTDERVASETLTLFVKVT